MTSGVPGDVGGGDGGGEVVLVDPGVVVGAEQGETSHGLRCQAAAWWVCWFQALASPFGGGVLRQRCRVRSAGVRLDVTRRVGLRLLTRLIRPGGLWLRRRPGWLRRRPPAGVRWQPNSGRRTLDRLVVGQGFGLCRGLSGPRCRTGTAPRRRTGWSRSACTPAGRRGRGRSGNAAGCQQVVDAGGCPRCCLLGRS